MIIDLPAADQGTFAVGDEVVVILPDDSETPGVVTEVGTVAQVQQNGTRCSR